MQRNLDNQMKNADPDYDMRFTDLFMKAEVTLALAKRRGRKIAVAESCTGGLLSALLTGVEGLSDHFERGFVCYTPEAKAEMLDIPTTFIEKHGVVSEEVAAAMARSAANKAHADLAVAVTGFAGPAGPQDEQGLVWLAVSDGSQTETKVCHFGAVRRGPARAMAANEALQLLGAHIAV